MRHLTRTAAATVASAAALVGTVAVAAPAHAETRECYSNTKTFSLPNKPDVKMLITLCVVRSGGLVQARADMSWTGGYGVIGGTRFNDFSLKLNLERSDDIKKTESYDQKWGLNNQYSNSRSLGFYMTDRPLGGWSADGVVTYDIADDGLGNYTWPLHGSPVIS